MALNKRRVLTVSLFIHHISIYTHRQKTSRQLQLTSFKQSSLPRHLMACLRLVSCFEVSLFSILFSHTVLKYPFSNISHQLLTKTYWIACDFLDYGQLRFALSVEHLGLNQLVMSHVVRKIAQPVRSDVTNIIWRNCAPFHTLRVACFPYVTLVQ